MHMLSANKLGALGSLLSDTVEGACTDLSPSAAALLLTLRYRPGTTGTELAAVAGVAQPTAARVLDGLVRRDLVERRPGAGRTVPLRLTPQGAARADGLQAARLAALARLLGALPAADRPAFERALDTILAAATTSRAQARTTCRLCDHATCDGPLCPIGTRATEIERGAAATAEKGDGRC